MNNNVTIKGFLEIAESHLVNSQGAPYQKYHNEDQLYHIRYALREIMEAMEILEEKIKKEN